MSKPTDKKQQHSGHLTLEELKDEVANGNFDTVQAGAIDMCGRIVGKRVPAHYFVKNGHKKVDACIGLLCGDIAQNFSQEYRSCNFTTGYGNCLMVPDLRTLRRMPWNEGNAVIICDVVDKKTLAELPFSPRAILKKQLARLEERGMKAMFASELEFYLFDESSKSARAKHWTNLSTTSPYHRANMLGISARDEQVMRKIRNGLEGAGIHLEGIMAEYGSGQQELNLCYINALDMADQHVVLKQACHEIAEAEGWCCSFMAKYSNVEHGSSCHIHNSLWSTSGQPLFHDPNDKRFGMSKLFRSWVAGQMKYAKEYMYFLAPYINSYKRLQPMSFAPTKIGWANDNRTASFRVVGIDDANSDGSSLRVECRVGGADLNPYLAFSGLIAAGLAGIDEELELPEPITGNAYEQGALEEVPRSLREASEAFEASTMMRKALGDDAHDHYTTAGRFEQSEFDKMVTDWELQRGFDRA